jgi:hypothetical protein
MTGTVILGAPAIEAELARRARNAGRAAAGARVGSKAWVWYCART